MKPNEGKLSNSHTHSQSLLKSCRNLALIVPRLSRYAVGLYQGELCSPHRSWATSFFELHELFLGGKVNCHNFGVASVTKHPPCSLPSLPQLRITWLKMSIAPPGWTPWSSFFLSVKESCLTHLCISRLRLRIILAPKYWLNGIEFLPEHTEITNPTEVM